MLEPGERTLYTDALKPPMGYQLSHGIGTTYSLELETLLSVPLAFSLYECSNQREILNNSILALDAIRRNANKLVIFCQHGEIKLSSTDSLLCSYLENMIIEVNPSTGGVFHPKLWLLRFINKEGDVFYKFICLSRNITFDRSWDTILVLDGKLMDTYFPGNEKLIQFLNFLPTLSVNKISQDRLKIIKQIKDELGKVRFISPENFDDEFSFHFLGMDSNKSFPIEDKYNRLLIISPFLDERLLERFDKVREKYLISSQNSLDEMCESTIKKYKKIWVLDELAEDQSEDDRRRLSGLHAKLYIGENGKNVTLWNGSSNATYAGFSSKNVEALVELRGERRDVGINKLLDEKSENSIIHLLKEYGKTELTDEEKEKDNLEKALEKKLEDYKEFLLKKGLKMKIESESDDLYKMIIYPKQEQLKYSEEEIDGFCYPITLLKQKQVNQLPIPLGWEHNIVFEKIPLLYLTSLVAFEFTIKNEGLERKAGFVLNLPVEGMPERRNDKIIRAILANPNGFIQYLRILLAENQNMFFYAKAMMHNPIWDYKDLHSSIPVPVAEELLKALSREPDKIKNINDLINELSKGNDVEEDIIPREFKEIWKNIWRTYKSKYGKSK
jgi:hypothetical protein